jgi:hypothetical protein
MHKLHVDVKEVREKRLRNLNLMQELRNRRTRFEQSQRKIVIDGLLADLSEYILDSKIQETCRVPLYVTLTDHNDDQLSKDEIKRVLEYVQELGCSASVCEREELCTSDFFTKVTLFFVSPFAMCLLKAGEAVRHITPSEIFLKISSTRAKEEQVHNIEDDEALAFKIAAEQ